MSSIAMKVQNNRWMSVSWHKGGHACPKCHRVLEHKDLMGHTIAGIFKVRGYLCPNCGKKHPENQENLQKFDWRRM